MKKRKLKKEIKKDHKKQIHTNTHTQSKLEAIVHKEKTSKVGKCPHKAI